MAEARPDPFTPLDCDLRDLDGFMLNIERLLASELWALSSGTSTKYFKAAVALWCRAWKQVPAASLPDNDQVIAAFATVSVAELRKWRGIIMRGFVQCADGRWYHKTLAEDANRAHGMKRRRLDERNADAERLKQWRERRRNAEETPSETPDETRFTTPTKPGETPTKRVRQDRDRDRDRDSSKEEAAAARANGSHPANGAGPPRWDDPAIRAGREAGETLPENLDRPIVNGWFLDSTWEQVLDASGMTETACPMTAKPLVSWLKDGYVPEQIVGTIAKVAARNNYDTPSSLAYFDQAIRQQPPREPPQ